MRNLAALLLLSATLLSGQTAPAELEVTYLANEGFLLRSGGHAVIIDGLFRQAMEPYESLPAEWREKLETATPPFHGADLVFVTHYHADHFDAESVARYLQHNPGARLVSSTEVEARVEERLGDNADILDRLLPVLPIGGPVVKDFPGIQLKVWQVTHGRDIQNLGYLITLGGKKVLHIGDSVAEEGELKSFHWKEEDIEIAFLPYWYLLQDEWKPHVKTLIGAKRIVVMHVPPRDFDRVSQQILAEFPEAVTFAQPMEKKIF